MLINPDVEAADNIAWICDKCGAMLNIQPGFSAGCGEWVCTVCEAKNRIDGSELYLSEDEYRAALSNPYKGLSDEEVLNLSVYEEIAPVNDRADITLVKHRKTGDYCIRKLLTTYDKSIYEYLAAHPVRHMPVIIEIYESSNCLIIIEEYIRGNTIDKLLGEKSFAADEAAGIVKSLCRILHELHCLPTPIIHRDIKPSNIMITPEGEVYLLDMNVAKWFAPGKTDDTKHMGTYNFAAPEQVGYGLSASSAKSDIYAVGMLLNVMITGAFPKEKRAEGPIWSVIERCISLEADRRYTAKELYDTLENMILA